MRAYVIALVLMLSFVFIIDGQSCTAFCPKNGKQIIMAKNLDWEIDLGYVFSNNSGVKKVSGCSIMDCLCNDGTGFFTISKENNAGLVNHVIKILSGEMDLSKKRVLFNRMVEYGNTFLY
jgi:hypothetical protein